MGFRPEPTLYNLNFAEDHPLHGLHVQMASLTVREYNAMMNRTLVTGEASLQAAEETLQQFADKLVEWDMEDKDGNPVPCTRAGLDNVEQPHLAAIVRAWQRAMMGISDDLGKESSNGSLSEEASLGLGMSSPNPPS